MKAFISTVFITCFIVCNSQTKDKAIDALETNLTQDTLIINEQKFIQILKDDRFYCLISTRQDTIIEKEDFYFNLEIADFDDDGNKDIRVYIMGNTANHCYNYLYDKQSKSFKPLQNCDIDFKKISRKNYYYTYFKNGCAGLDFGSYLGKIDNYNFINLGYIAENGCDDDTINVPRNFKIYKTEKSNNEETLKLIQTFNYDSFEGIETYWINNCDKFGIN